MFLSYKINIYLAEKIVKKKKKKKRKRKVLNMSFSFYQKKERGI